MADTGPGIPAEELPHVFDFGYRGELARATPRAGSGSRALGLPGARRAQRREPLSIDGQPGAGVTASLTLPAAAKERT